MRILSLTLSVFACLAGCSGPPPIDSTPNRMEPEADAYVPGPYGYTQGSTIENLQFLAKWDPAGLAGTAVYDELPMQQLSLADVRRDPDVRYLVLIAAAGWCGPCKVAARELPALEAQYVPKGFRFLETLSDGYPDAQDNVLPAAEADLNRWAKEAKLHSIVALDPQDWVHRIAEEQAYPFMAVVRASDMKIVSTWTSDHLAEYLPIIDKQ